MKRVFPRFALIACFPAFCALTHLAPGACFRALGSNRVFWLRSLIGSLRGIAFIKLRVKVSKETVVLRRWG